MAARDVIVVGGGTIGLAVAWRALERGLGPVRVLDAEDPPGAWRVAAGMLAPVAEADFGEEALLELGRRGAERFAPFCDRLAAASGRDPGHRASGTLVVARDADEAAQLDRLHALQASLGLASERLAPSAARRLEPALAPTVRRALVVPGDHSVEPRALRAALREGVRRAGGELRAPARVAALELGPAAAGGRVGVRLAGGERLEADAVVLAAGAASSRVAGVPEAAQVPVRPVKGQVLRLRDPDGPGLVARTVRTPEAYLVPRPDGAYVLGATVEERGWSTAPTAGGLYALVREMGEVIPGVLELDVDELGAGLRPGTPDNLPAIGPGAVPGLHWATGHWRNGILLTPVTADLVVAGLAGEPLPAWAAAADPRRFAPGREVSPRPAAVRSPA